MYKKEPTTAEYGVKREVTRRSASSQTSSDVDPYTDAEEALRMLEKFADGWTA
jgi:hypothetical protein